MKLGMAPETLAMTAGVLIGSLFAGGCAGRNYPTSYEVYVDPAFADGGDSETALLQAIAAQTGVTFNITIENLACGPGDGGCISIHPASLATIRTVGGNAGDVGVTTLCHDNESSYNGWANSYVPLDHTDQDLSHEIGHALGLVHTGSGTVMCAKSDCAAQAWTCADTNQYLDLRGLPEVVCTP